MANLHFHYGVMGSSKSAQLIVTAFNFKQNNVNTEVIKPDYDTRFADDKIISRIGIEAPATSLKNLDGYVPRDNTCVILVDEIQFFAPRDIDNLVHIADDMGRIVMCYGLMVDSNQKLFPASQRLIEVGVKLHRIESNCQISGCAKMATHHLRFDANGNVVRDGEQIQLGDTNFKSVCRRHFNDIYNGRGRKGR